MTSPVSDAAKVDTDEEPAEDAEQAKLEPAEPHWDSFTMWHVLEQMELEATAEIEGAQELLEGSIHQVHELYHARCNYGDKRGVIDHMRKQGHDKSHLHNLKWKEACRRIELAEERLRNARHGAHVEENQAAWCMLWCARGRLDMLRHLRHQFKDKLDTTDDSVMREISRIRAE